MVSEGQEVVLVKHCSANPTWLESGLEDGEGLLGIMVSTGERPPPLHMSADFIGLESWFGVDNGG